MKLEGYRTYITLAVAAAYWIAVNRGLFPRVPEIDAALVVLVVGFLRQGSKDDANKAVQQINDPDAAADAKK